MSSKAKQIILVAVAVLSLGAAAAAGEEPRKLELGKLLPEDGICFVRIKSANALLGGISDFVDAIQPGVSAMIKAQLGTKLAVDPAAAGLDADKPAGIAILNPKEFKEPWVVVLPVSDEKQAFLTELQNMLGAPEDAGADLLKYGLGAEDQNLFLRIAAGHVVVGGSDAAVSTIADAVKKNGLGAHDADDTLVAAVNVKQVLKLYGDDLQEALKELRESVGGDLGGAGGAGGAAGVGGPFAMFAMVGKLAALLGPDLADMGADVLKQVDGVEVSLTINKDKLAITETLFAKPGTSLAKLIDAQEPVGAGAAELVPAGGLFTILMRFNEGAMKPHLDAATKKIRETLGKAEGDDEMKGLRDEIVGWTELFDAAVVGGNSEIATALVPSGGGIANLQVVVRPEMPLEKMLKLMQDATKMVADSKLIKAALAAGGGQLKMTFEKDFRERGGVKISRLTQETVGQMPQMAAMQDKMYGSPQITEIAYLAGKKTYVMVGGKEAAKRLDALLDRVSQGNAEGSFGRSAVYAELRQKTPKNACTVWALSPTLYAKVVLDIMAPMMPFQIPADKLKALTDMASREKPVWGYVQSTGGVATMTFEVHAPTIGQLARFFQQMFMEMQGGGMQPGGGGGPVPPPPPDGGIGGGVF